MIAMLLLAICTTQGKHIYCPTIDMCVGIHAPCTVGDPPKKKVVVKSDNTCTGNNHPHPIGYDLKEPDVKNGPVYIPDGQCHDNHTDKVTDGRTR